MEDKLETKENLKAQRQSEIIRASIVGIALNLLLVLVKYIVGLASQSIAIKSDAINNLSDASSSMITIMGTKLASKEADRRHPYGHGRIEYISSLLISSSLLVLGLEFLKSSALRIRDRSPVDFKPISILVLIMAVFIKLFMAVYNKKLGEKTNSPALLASSKDAFSDLLISSITIVSALVSIFTDLRIDAYIGIVVSGFIIYSGISLVSDTINKIIGERAESALGQEIYDFVNGFPKVEASHDLMLNNYGPDRYLGSMNISFLDTMTLEEASLELFKLQNAVLNEFDIYLVFGIYAKNTQNKRVIEDELRLKKVLEGFPDVLDYHAFYIVYEDRLMRFDIVVNFEVEDKDGLLEGIRKELANYYEDYEILINIDHKYV